MSIEELINDWKDLLEKQKSGNLSQEDRDRREKLKHTIKNTLSEVSQKVSIPLDALQVAGGTGDESIIKEIDHSQKATSLKYIERNQIEQPIISLEFGSNSFEQPASSPDDNFGDQTKSLRHGKIFGVDWHDGDNAEGKKPETVNDIDLRSYRQLAGGPFVYIPKGWRGKDKKDHVGSIFDAIGLSMPHLIFMLSECFDIVPSDVGLGRADRSDEVSESVLFGEGADAHPNQGNLKQSTVTAGDKRAELKMKRKKGTANEKVNLTEIDTSQSELKQRLSIEDQPPVMAPKYECANDVERHRFKTVMLSRLKAIIRALSLMAVDASGIYLCPEPNLNNELIELVAETMPAKGKSVAAVTLSMFPRVMQKDIQDNAQHLNDSIKFVKWPSNHVLPLMRGDNIRDYSAEADSFREAGADPITDDDLVESEQLFMRVYNLLLPNIIAKAIETLKRSTVPAFVAVQRVVIDKLGSRNISRTQLEAFFRQDLGLANEYFFVHDFKRLAKALRAANDLVDAGLLGRILMRIIATKNINPFGLTHFIIFEDDIDRLYFLDNVEKLIPSGLFCAGGTFNATKKMLRAFHRADPLIIFRHTCFNGHSLAVMHDWAEQDKKSEEMWHRDHRELRRKQKQIAEEEKSISQVAKRRLFSATAKVAPKHTDASDATAAGAAATGAAYSVDAISKDTETELGMQPGDYREPSPNSASKTTLETCAQRAKPPTSNVLDFDRKIKDQYLKSVSWHAEDDIIRLRQAIIMEAYSNRPSHGVRGARCVIDPLEERPDEGRVILDVLKVVSSSHTHITEVGGRDAEKKILMQAYKFFIHLRKLEASQFYIAIFLNTWILLLSFTITTVAILTEYLRLQYPGYLTADMAAGLAAANTAMPLLLGIVISVDAGLHPTAKNAALAFAKAQVLSEIFKYRCRIGDYEISDDPHAPPHRTAFTNAIKNIWNGLPNIQLFRRTKNVSKFDPDVDEAHFRPTFEDTGDLKSIKQDGDLEDDDHLYDTIRQLGLIGPQGEVEHAFKALNAKEYIDTRLIPSLIKVERQGPAWADTEQVLQAVIIIASSAGALLSVYGLQIWIPVLLAFVGVLQGYMKVRVVSLKAQQMNALFNKLENILFWWRGLRVVQQQLPQMKAQLVEEVEKAILDEQQLITQAQAKYSSRGNKDDEDDDVGKQRGRRASQ